MEFERETWLRSVIHPNYLETGHSVTHRRSTSATEQVEESRPSHTLESAQLRAYYTGISGELIV